LSSHCAEGLEAFLIVAISLAYLKKTGECRFFPPSLGHRACHSLSVGAGLLLAHANNQALWEGMLALVAAVLVASLTVHMWRAGKRMKARDRRAPRGLVAQARPAAFMGVFGFTLPDDHARGHGDGAADDAVDFHRRSRAGDRGAAAGTVSAAFIAWLWSRYGYRSQPVSLLPGHGRISFSCSSCSS
jgi:high-affinity iron transporter